MANENQSRDSSRQQSAERSQTGSSQQGTGAAQQGTSYGQGSQGGYNNPSGQGGGRYGGQGSSQRSTGLSTWQGGRQGAPSQARGSSLSPYYGGGYGPGPFSIIRRISDEMDRLFENFGMGRSLFPSQSAQGGAFDAGSNEWMPSMWSPHIEVHERNGKLVIEADLPGMKRDDVNVRVEDDEVVIQGERRQESSGNQAGYYRSERSYGSFYRTIPLPEGTNADTANATFRDGVLEIEFDMPRPQQRGRTLQIREGSQSQGASGTGSGATYGSGTTGSMEGASSGSTGSQRSASGAATGGQQAQSGTGGSAGGGVRQSSGSGTMYSGSGNPSVGAAGMGPSQSGGASGKPGDKSRT